jgi:hypothetical protein
MRNLRSLPLTYASTSWPVVEADLELRVWERIHDRPIQLDCLLFSASAMLPGPTELQWIAAYE